MQRIVVGVDGSESSKEALRWAIDEAAARHAVVEAVMVWSYLAQPVPGSDRFRPDWSDEEAAAALAAIVDEVAGADPAVTVKQTVVCDLPARGLLDVAADADLLVVGRRGQGGFRGLRLGSVSSQCAHHARCPIVILPARD